MVDTDESNSVVFFGKGRVNFAQKKWKYTQFDHSGETKMLSKTPGRSSPIHSNCSLKNLTIPRVRELKNVPFTFETIYPRKKSRENSLSATG